MPTAPRTPAVCEPVEHRILMKAPVKVAGVFADNRGEIVIRMTQFVQNVSKDSVRLFVGGTDGVVGTADDVRPSYNVRYEPANGRIVVRAKNLGADTGYRVQLESDLLRNSENRRLDGEFNGGSTVSGNGTQGGDYNFQAKTDKGATPTVRMYGSEGVVDIRLRRDAAPISAANFLKYANAGRYDYAIVTRSIPGFVAQMGGLQITGNGQQFEDLYGAPALDAGFGVENRVLNNTRGTLSFARAGDTATNEFFFNYADNSSTLNQPVPAQGQNTTFTPFAEVIGTGGLTVLDAIEDKPVLNFGGALGAENESGGTDDEDVPLNSTDGIDSLDDITPIEDFVNFRRVAVEMLVRPVF